MITTTNIMTNARRLSAYLSSERSALTNLQPERESTQLKTRPGAGEKVHSGKRQFSPPADFVAVEAWVDMDRAIEKGDVNEVQVNYFRLASLVNW